MVLFPPLLYSFTIYCILTKKYSFAKFVIWMYSFEYIHSSGTYLFTSASDSIIMVAVSAFIHLYYCIICNFMNILEFNLSILLLMDIGLFWVFLLLAMLLWLFLYLSPGVYMEGCLQGTPILRSWTAGSLCIFWIILGNMKLFSIWVIPVYTPIGMFNHICNQALNLCLPTLLLLFVLHLLIQRSNLHILVTRSLPVICTTNIFSQFLAYLFSLLMVPMIKSSS